VYAGVCYVDRSDPEEKQQALSELMVGAVVLLIY